MIAHARRDSRGQYSGDAAGDQDHGEIAITEWYNRPWNVVLRAPRARDRWKIAEIAEAIAKNDNIGYDQNERTTLYKYAKLHNFRIEDITEKCECDCSSMVAVCCIAAGFNVSPDIYTGIERAALEKCGFLVIKSSEHLSREDYLLRGDILLYEGHHTAVNITDGKSIKLYDLGWNKDTKQKEPGISQWWYADTPTTYYHDCWRVINHHYYYFDSNGYALIGDHVINGDMYHLATGKEKNSQALQCALCNTDEFGALKPWYIS